MDQKPLLSIGIIFKNEIRCLERCLESLTPLRQALPCELIMADTGSDDGSRAVAEKYADLVIDFPWINDFAAARNAVMDRCSGKWYLSLDCDEWLVGDTEGICDFVRNNTGHDYGAISLRNYKTEALEAGGVYTDFSAIRMLRMSTGVRYTGAIHEQWLPPEGASQSIYLVSKLRIDHDGYVTNTQWDSNKMDRNMALLRKKLEKNPRDLLVLEQCIESGQGSVDFIDYVRRARAGVLAKEPGWELLGASILRYAVYVANNKNMPELDDWIKEAEELFPDSIYTNIDVAWFAFGQCWDKDDYEGCVRLGRRYLKALEDYDARRYDPRETLFNSLLMASPTNRASLRVFLGDALLRTGEPEQGLETLLSVDGTMLGGQQAENMARTLILFHGKTNLDTEPLVRQVWEQISQPKPGREKALERQARFIQASLRVFPGEYRDYERENEKFCRHAYTAFLPLEGLCSLGDGAALLETEDRQALTEKLSAVKHPEELAPAALAHALLAGVPFPLPGRPLYIERMDGLASLLAREWDALYAIFEAAVQSNFTADMQSLSWVRTLALTAVKTCSWQDAAQGMVLARHFAAVERAFLSACYVPALLQEDGLRILPPMHRFGWHCALAFDALDSGDAVGYVRLLRAGLASCEGMRAMVEFLTKNTPALQPAQPSEELRLLADRVRAMLAAYPADDPAVAALKASPVYQKVAPLIETGEAPAAGIFPS